MSDFACGCVNLLNTSQAATKPTAAQPKPARTPPMAATASREANEGGRAPGDPPVPQEADRLLPSQETPDPELELGLKVHLLTAPALLLQRSTIPLWLDSRAPELFRLVLELPTMLLTCLDPLPCTSHASLHSSSYLAPSYVILSCYATSPVCHVGDRRAGGAAGKWCCQGIEQPVGRSEWCSQEGALRALLMIRFGTVWLCLCTRLRLDRVWPRTAYGA